MWIKRLGFGMVLLIAGIVFLIQPIASPDVRVSAYAPTVIPTASLRAPSASSSLYFPFVSNTFVLTAAPLWRFGVDKARLPISTYNSLDVAAMRFGWYIDFSVTASPETLYGMEYMPTVRVKQYKRDQNGNPTLCCVGCAYMDPPAYSVSPSLSAIQSIAASRRGMTWIVGNEMERIDWSGMGGVCARQDEMLPEVYAQAYHDIYEAIKTADNTAQVALGGLVQPSPLRLKYLDRVWAQYAISYTMDMPVDVWNIHVYVYNEQKGSWGADIPAGLTETVGSVYQVRDHKDFNIAAGMLVNWRTWMKNHGQQGKPLITSEYGVVFPEWVQDPPGVTTFSPSQIRDSFMYPSFDYFLNHTDANLGYALDGNRVMQRWGWFSMDYDDGECDTGVFYPDNTSNLFYSGLGPSLPPTNCPYPTQGRSPFGTYWIQYVQTLPAGASKPYAPVRAPAVTRATTAPAAVRDASNAALCSDSRETRAEMLRSLPSRDTPEGKQVWLSVLSKLTAGTRICLPGSSQ